MNKELTEICLKSESLLREHMFSMFTKQNCAQFLLLKIVPEVCDKFTSHRFLDHIKTQNNLDNHKVQLIKLIIEIYLKIRIHYEASKRNKEKVRSRQKFTKLILFSNE